MAFGITPASPGFPPDAREAFAKFLEFRLSGVALGDRGVQVLDITGDGVSVTRGVGENAHVVTIRRDAVALDCPAGAFICDHFDTGADMSDHVGEIGAEYIKPGRSNSAQVLAASLVADGRVYLPGNFANANDHYGAYQASGMPPNGSEDDVYFEMVFWASAPPEGATYLSPNGGPLVELILLGDPTAINTQANYTGITARNADKNFNVINYTYIPFTGPPVYSGYGDFGAFEYDEEHTVRIELSNGGQSVRVLLDGVEVIASTEMPAFEYTAVVVGLSCAQASMNAIVVTPDSMHLSKLLGVVA